MKKPNHFILAISAAAALVLTACGGGSDGTSTTTATGSGTGSTSGTGTGATSGTGTGGTAGTATAPVTATFTGYSHLQNLDASGSTANYRDIGVGAAGTLTFGATGTVVSMTPLSDGGITYGVPITAGVAVGNNLVAANLPAIAMLCQTAASGDGTNGRKSTDVLVKAQAVRITDAAGLAGQTFSVSREDCAVSAGRSLKFDAQGNATVTDSSGAETFAASAVSNALSGNAPLGNSSRGFAAFYAYSYQKSDGSLAYAVVEHGGATTTGLTRGYVALWAQQ